MSEPSRSTSPARHFRLRMAAVWYFGARLGLLVLVVAVPLAYWQFGWTDWRWGAVAGGVVGSMYLLAWFLASSLRCAVCSEPTLRGSSKPRHAYAGKWLGVSYPARVAWDILTAEYHHCMYCHSRCRNAAPSLQGVGKPGVAHGTAGRPDLAALMGPGLAVAVESPREASGVVILEAPVVSGELNAKPSTAIPVPQENPVLAEWQAGGIPPAATDSLKRISVPVPPALPPVATPLVPLVERSALQAPTAPVPLAADPLASAAPAFPPTDLSPTPAPAMSTPATPPSIPTFPFQDVLFGQALGAAPLEIPPPPAASGSVGNGPPPLSLVGAVVAPPALPLAGSPPLVLPSHPEPTVLEKEPISFFGAVRPPSLPTGASPFLNAPPLGNGVPAAALPMALPPEPAKSAPQPPLPVPMPALETPELPHAVPALEADPLPRPAPVVPSIAAPAVPLDAVIKVLQEGRASMELAFQGMIDQLRNALETASIPSTARVETPEAPAVALSVPVPVPEAFSLPLPVPPVATVCPPHEPGLPPLVPPAAAPSLMPASGAMEPTLPAFPDYPPLYPVAPAAAGGIPPAVSEGASAGNPAPIRRRPLPAISPNLIAELDSTLAQAFAPGAEAGTASAPVPPAPLPPPPLPGAADSPHSVSLPPPSVPPGNSFAPAPAPWAADSAVPPPGETYGEAAPAVPAPFSFLQAVPVPEAWPQDGLSDLSPAETPPMWTRTRGNPSLS